MKKLCLISLVIVLVIALVGGLILTSCGGPEEVTPPPTQKEIFDAKLARLVANAASMPIPVDDVIQSLTGPVVKYFNCPLGSPVDECFVWIRTAVKDWDPKEAAPNSAGTYGWDVTSWIGGGVKIISATNWIMLDPAVTIADENNPPLGTLADEGLLYHELLHGQLQINAMDTDEWRAKACKCEIDLGQTDSNHVVIPPAVDGYLTNRAPGVNVRVIEPTAKQADKDGNFTIDLGPTDKTDPSGEVLEPTGGSNVKDVTVEVVDGSIHVKGTLIDKTKPGKFFLRIDPGAEWIIGGLENAIVVLPPSDEITIGAARSLSGGLESIGGYAFGPVLDYWVEEVNAAGGINVAGKYLPVELDIQDDESDLSMMTSLLSGMIASGDYDFVFAPVSTAFLQAAAMICNANEYILMGAEGGCTSIMDDLVNLPYFFGVLNFANHNQMEELFKLLDDFQTNQGAPDPMDIYVIYNNDLDGYEYRDAFVAEAANYSGHFNIVGQMSVAPFATDVSTQLLAANASGADMFCSFTYPSTTMTVVGQAIALGINFDAMVLSWGANFQYFYDTFGTMTEGIIGLGAWNEDTSAAAAAFAADMIAMHGRDKMDWWGQLYYYAGLQCFQQAIERAGILDQSVIRDILATEHFTTVLGDTWFEDANGNHPITAGGGLLAVECHPGQIGQWQSGIFEVIDMGPNRTAVPIYPKPNWP